MGRVARTSLPDGYFHIYTRSTPATPAFPADEDRRAFMKLLALCSQRFQIRLLSACVLTTHYHLVVEATHDELSKAMHWLNGTYARGFNQRHGRFGPLFAERFSARVIDSDRSLADTCAGPRWWAGTRR